MPVVRNLLWQEFFFSLQREEKRREEKKREEKKGANRLRRSSAQQGLARFVVVTIISIISKKYKKSWIIARAKLVNLPAAVNAAAAALCSMERMENGEWRMERGARLWSRASRELTPKFANRNLMSCPYACRCCSPHHLHGCTARRVPESKEPITQEIFSAYSCNFGKSFPLWSVL